MDFLFCDTRTNMISNLEITMPSRNGLCTVAPVALFVYNRPLHTRKTVESLLLNDLASETDLIIFSDAPKNLDAVEAVDLVREYIKTISGFKSIVVVERDSNWGLARSIIDGVSQLCNKYGRAIVLEDDLVSSPYFLNFMNEGLDFYQDKPEVMHISGSTYPVDINKKIDTYFLKLPLCWGWATWDRAWRDFQKDIAVMDRFTPDAISRFNFDDSNPTYWGQLEANRQGKISTWFIFWYATIFLKNGLVLFPQQSLLQNIGMDGTGVHCDANDDYTVEISAEPIKIADIPMIESKEAFARHKKYFKTLQPSIFSRVVRKVNRIMVGSNK